uniref:FHA domain-containing protein n=1 Tax=Anopheles dirus TaxID=7168 RepID=A0A182NSN9_9DIPT
MFSINGAHIAVLNKESGEEVNRILVENKWITFGAHPNNHVRLHTPEAERLHCKVFADSPNSVIVKNFSQHNPVLVNGVQLERKTTLNDKDRIEVAGCLFVWHFAPTNITVVAKRTDKRTVGENRRKTTALKRIRSTDDFTKKGSSKVPRAVDLMLQAIRTRRTVHSIITPAATHGVSGSDELSEQCYSAEGEKTLDDNKIQLILNSSETIASPCFTPDKENKTLKRIQQLNASGVMLTSYHPPEERRHFACKTPIPAPGRTPLRSTNVSLNMTAAEESSVNVSNPNHSMYLIDLTTPTGKPRPTNAVRKVLSSKASQPRVLDSVNLITPSPKKINRTPISSRVAVSTPKITLLKSAIKNLQTTHSSSLKKTPTVSQSNKKTPTMRLNGVRTDTPTIRPSSKASALKIRKHLISTLAESESELNSNSSKLENAQKAFANLSPVCRDKDSFVATTNMCDNSENQPDDGADESLTANVESATDKDCVNAMSSFDVQSVIKTPNRTTQIRSAKYSDITPHESFMEEAALTITADLSISPLRRVSIRSLKGSEEHDVNSAITGATGTCKVRSEPASQEEIPAEVESLSTGDTKCLQVAESLIENDVVVGSPQLRQSLRDTRKFIGSAFTSLNTSRPQLDLTAEIDESLLLNDEDDMTCDTNDMYDITNMDSSHESTTQKEEFMLPKDGTDQMLSEIKNVGLDISDSSKPSSDVVAESLHGEVVPHNIQITNTIGKNSTENTPSGCIDSSKDQQLPDLATKFIESFDSEPAADMRETSKSVDGNYDGTQGDVEWKSINDEGEENSFDDISKSDSVLPKDASRKASVCFGDKESASSCTTGNFVDDSSVNLHGVKNLMKTPKNVNVNYVGVKELLQTPKVVDRGGEALDDMHDIFQTPVMKTLNELNKLDENDEVMETSAVQDNSIANTSAPDVVAPEDAVGETPVITGDEESVSYYTAGNTADVSVKLHGLKDLMKTPKTININYVGVKELLQTPKVVDSGGEALDGMRDIFQTPMMKTLNDLNKPDENEEVMETSAVQDSSIGNTSVPDVVTPEDAVGETPVITGDEESVSYSTAGNTVDVSVKLHGVKDLLKTPKTIKVNYVGVKELLQTPKVVDRGSEALDGMRDIFQTPVMKPLNELNNTHEEVDGAAAAPTNGNIENESLTVESVQDSKILDVFKTPDISSKKRRLFSKTNYDFNTPDNSNASPSPLQNTTEDFFNVYKTNSSSASHKGPTGIISAAPTERRNLPKRSCRNKIESLSEVLLAGPSPKPKYCKPIDAPAVIVDEKSPEESKAVNRRKVAFNEQVDVKEINSPSIVGDIIRKASSRKPRGKKPKTEEVVQTESETVIVSNDEQNSITIKEDAVITNIKHDELAATPVRKGRSRKAVQAEEKTETESVETKDDVENNEASIAHPTSTGDNDKPETKVNTEHEIEKVIGKTVKRGRAQKIKQESETSNAAKENDSVDSVATNASPTNAEYNDNAETQDTAKQEIENIVEQSATRGRARRNVETPITKLAATPVRKGRSRKAVQAEEKTETESSETKDDAVEHALVTPVGKGRRRRVVEQADETFSDKDTEHVSQMAKRSRTVAHKTSDVEPTTDRLQEGTDEKITKSKATTRSKKTVKEAADEDNVSSPNPE